MGYNTRYELNAIPWPEGLSDYLENDEAINYALDRNGNCSDSCKWYDHEDDMLELSLAFPTVHFTLSGEGEEAGDIWEKHFINGKVQFCKAIITIPPFNAELLQ